MPSPFAFLQTMELAQQPAKPQTPESPTGFVFSTTQKGLLLVIVMTILYLRLYRRRRKNDKTCSHCNHRNPPHQSNCAKCSAPLFRK